MADKVPTGIENLDALLGGGFPKGSSVLIIGEPGAGKTTLLRKFLQKGVADGDDCIYFMTNRSFDHVLANLAKSGWEITEDQANPHFILYDGVVVKRAKSLIGNFDDLIDVAYNCEKLISTFSSGNTRLIIDDLSYLFLMNNKETVFKFLHRIFQIMKQSNVTCLIEMQKGMLDPQIVTSVESMTDGTIEMRREEPKDALRVSRLENENIKSDWISFGVSAKLERGVDIERTLNNWENMLLGGETHDEETVSGMLKEIRSDSKKKTPPGSDAEKKGQGPKAKKSGFHIFRG